MKSSNRGIVVSAFSAAIAVGLAASMMGCSRAKVTTSAQPTQSAFTVKTSGNTNLVITPASSLVGRVFSVNTQAKFVVVTFPIGQLPANDTRFSVFHAGMKVGEIRITIPPAPIGDGVSADIITGSAQEGDEVRTE